MIKAIRNLFALIFALFMTVTMKIQSALPITRLPITVSTAFAVMYFIGGLVTFIITMIATFAANVYTPLIVYITVMIFLFGIVHPVFCAGCFSFRKVTSQALYNDEFTVGNPTGVMAIDINEMKSLTHYSTKCAEFFDLKSVSSSSDVIYLITMFGSTAFYINEKFMSIVALDDRIIKAIETAVERRREQYRIKYESDLHQSNISTWMKK